MLQVCGNENRAVIQVPKSPKTNQIWTLTELNFPNISSREEKLQQWENSPFSENQFISNFTSPTLQQTSYWKLYAYQF